MKKITWVILLVAVLCQGCLVRSLRPFYHDEDIVFKNELIGTWADEDKSEWRIHANPFKKGTYEIHLKEKTREVAFLGALFMINGDLYLDVYPVEDNTQEVTLFDLHMVPTHSVARVVSLDQNTASIKWFNEDWLHSLFEQKKIRISHAVVPDDKGKLDKDGSYLLTASTDELQAFLQKYGNEPGAFEGENALKVFLRKNNP